MYNIYENLSKTIFEYDKYVKETKEKGEIPLTFKELIFRTQKKQLKEEDNLEK